MSVESSAINNQKRRASAGINGVISLKENGDSMAAS